MILTTDKLVMKQTEAAYVKHNQEVVRPDVCLQHLLFSIRFLVSSFSLLK